MKLKEILLKLDEADEFKFLDNYKDGDKVNITFEGFRIKLGGIIKKADMLTFVVVETEIFNKKTGRKEIDKEEIPIRILLKLPGCKIEKI
jgi:hypothetical protein